MTKYWEGRILKTQEAVFKDSLRILKALQCKPLRYSQIKRLLNLKSTRLKRLLKMLRKEFWIVVRAVPNKAFVKFHELHKKEQWNKQFPAIPPKNCKILAVYELTKRGALVLRAYVK